MTENKMTESEIMKALECHKEREIDTCSDCPYFNVDGCGYELSGYALDLINRKNADIERLSVVAHLGNMRANDYRVMRDRAFKAEAEIEAARAEAIKEFAERVKAKAIQKFDWNEYVEVEDIDQIAKEMGVEL